MGVELKTIRKQNSVSDSECESEFESSDMTGLTASDDETGSIASELLGATPTASNPPILTPVYSGKNEGENL